MMKSKSLVVLHSQDLQTKDSGGKSVKLIHCDLFIEILIFVNFTALEYKIYR